MFANYNARGDAFAAAVHRLRRSRTGEDGRGGPASADHEADPSAPRQHPRIAARPPPRRRRVRVAPGPPADLVLPDPRRQPAAGARPDDGLCASMIKAFEVTPAAYALLPQAARPRWHRAACWSGSPSRLPTRLLPVPYPLLIVAVFLLVLTQTRARHRGQRQPQLARSRAPSSSSPASSPSSRSSCGAPTSTPSRTSASATAWHTLVPLVPVVVMLLGLVVLGATWVRRSCSSRSCSACSGWPARRRGCSACALVAGRSDAFSSSRPSPSRMSRLSCFVDPRTSRAPCWQAVTASTRLRPADVRLRPRCKSAEVGRTPRTSHRLHLRRARGGARSGRDAVGARPVRGLGYAGIRVAGRTEDPFVRYRRRDHHLAHRPRP